MAPYETLAQTEKNQVHITIKDGLLKAPDGLGLGITLRPEIVNEIIENGSWS